MIQRDSNRRVLLVFVLCGAAVSVAGWTLSEKFIQSPQAAFWINLAVSAVIALVFARTLEGRLNRSADFLMGKIRRVAAGDLTQRFKEDPDDILPYGLSYELGEAMNFLRDRIGGLWKTAALLSRQLEQFISATREGVGEVRREAAGLGELSKSLDNVRAAAADLSKRVADLRVETASELAALGQVRILSGQLTEDFTRHRERITKISGELAAVDDLTGRLEGSLAEFSNFSRQMAGLGKSLQEITTGSSLVALNAAIDATRQGTGEGNFGALVGEIRTLVEALNEAAHNSGITAGGADSRVLHAAGQLKEGRENVRKGLGEVTRAQELIGRSAAESGDASEKSERLHGHLKQVHALVEDMDGRTADFSLVVKNATAQFDKLLSDVQITLLKFGALEEKTAGLTQNLRRLEEFKNIFEIA